MAPKHYLIFNMLHIQAHIKPFTTRYFQICLPMNDFGMVILSQTLSLTSSPEVGLAITLAMRYMGVVKVNLPGSPEGEKNVGLIPCWERCIQEV